MCVWVCVGAQCQALNEILAEHMFLYEKISFTHMPNPLAHTTTQARVSWPDAHSKRAFWSVLTH